MAANTETAPEEGRTVPRDITNVSREDEVQSSTPLEMSSLASKPGAPETTESLQQSVSESSKQAQKTETIHDATTSPVFPVTSNTAPPPLSETQSQYKPSPIARQQSTAIGPSSDASLPLLPSKDNEPAGPTLLITLLLTNGARHPFRLDSKYLQKRHASVPNDDPFNLSVYKLKELILREWREEWEAKPVSPSYIRLISFGKLLDDKGVLRDSRFNHEAPNVVHMTIKPQDYVEDEDAKGAKGGYSASRDANERSPGCRCVVM